MLEPTPQMSNQHAAKLSGIMGERIPFSQAALFLDFDGTLAGFQDNPDLVRLTRAEHECILKLGRKFEGALAIISGRDIEDLCKRAPAEFWRLGNHGLYGAAPNQAAGSMRREFPYELRAKIEESLENLPDMPTVNGLWVEDKGPILAIHHRMQPSAGPNIERAIASLIDQDSDLVIQIGHCVVEIKPSGANKGQALLKHMQTPGFIGRLPIMIGDDTTDEDGFSAAQSLGGFGIKVGQGPTCAKYRLDTIEDVYALFRNWI